MADTIAARVARGAALLDERMPGWDQRINLDRLDLHSPCRCILGQIFPASSRDGGYWDGIKELGLASWGPDPGGAEAYGFTTARNFQMLTAEWRRVIGARRAGGAS